MALTGVEGPAVGIVGPVASSSASSTGLVFDTRTDAIAAHIPSPIDIIETGGYSTLGDGGGATYIRSISVSSGGFTSADGAHWDITLFSNNTIVPQMFGAVGNGVADDAVAFQAAIDACIAFKTRRLRIPSSRYKISTALSLICTSLIDYSGLTIEGDGWSPGASPATNSGSWIEFNGASGSALKLWGQSGNNGSGDVLLNVTIRDIAIGSTNASYNGDLVDIRTAGDLISYNVGLWGLSGTATAHSLVIMNEIVNSRWSNCQFANSINGIIQANLGLTSGDYITVANIDHTIFSSITTSIDIRLSGNQTINIENGCVFEPGLNGDATAVKITATSTSIIDSWAGDSSTNLGTAFLLSGPGSVVDGNYIAGAAVGVQVTVGARISNNALTGNTVAVLDAGGSIVDGNNIAVPSGGIGIHATSVGQFSHYIDNLISGSGVGGSNGYLLDSGTLGYILDNINGAGTSPLIVDNSGGGGRWKKTFQWSTQYAIASDSFNTSRLSGVRSITDGGTYAPANTCQYTFLTATGGLATPIVTVTNNYVLNQFTDSSVICNGSGTITLTLPSAASYPGRWIIVRTIAAFTVVSASSNVVPLAGGAAGTAILAATPGKYVMLQSDATNWQIMIGN